MAAAILIIGLLIKNQTDYNHAQLQKLKAKHEVECAIQKRRG